MTALASKGQLRMSLLRHALVAVPLVVLLGTVSGRIAGAGEGNAWFVALAKPDLMPPGWVFGLVWTILYVLLGTVLAMLLHARGARRRGQALALFILQLAVNLAWSPLFFAFHRVDWALTAIGAMIVLTVALIVLTWPIRRLAALLLLPYLAWLCFAALLTAQIMARNPGAAGLVPQPSSADIVL
jgi:benzodiazapine receptor